MKQILKFISIAIPAFTLLLLAGCDNDNDATVDSPIAARITSTIASGNTETLAALPTGMPATRASESAFTPGDCIGVSATSPQGTTAYANIRYATSGTGSDFTVVNAAGEDNDIYFQDKLPVNFTAYYPYEGTNGTRPGANGVIARTLTTAHQAEDALPGIDYLWSAVDGITSAAPQVRFIFAHRMSRLKLNFVEGSGMHFPAGGLTYTLDGLRQAGTFNTLNGAADADADAPIAKLEGIPVSTIAQHTLSTLILWPQEAATAKITVVVAGISFGATIQLPALPTTAGVPRLAPGYSYTYNVKVNKTGIEIGKAEITPWTQGTGGDVNAKEED